MTHAELYEIVKDHEDTWGEQFKYDEWRALFIEQSPQTINPIRGDIVESSLLGLGVAWLVEHGGSARLYPPLPTKSEYFVGTEAYGAWWFPSLLASVYAAIAEVKKEGA